MDAQYKISLSEIQRRELIEFYKNKILEGENQIKEFKELINQLENPVPVSGGQIDSPTTTSYRTGWSWTLKVKFILKLAQKCLTTREIIDRIKEHEPDLENPINSVSGVISGKIGKGIVFNRYRPYEGGDNYIGLIEWFDEEGNVLPQYRGFE